MWVSSPHPHHLFWSRQRQKDVRNKKILWNWCDISQCQLAEEAFVFLYSLWRFLVQADLRGQLQDFGTCFPTSFVMRAEHPNPLWTAFKTAAPASSLSFLGDTKVANSSSQGHEDLSRVDKQRWRGTNQSWGCPWAPCSDGGAPHPRKDPPAPLGIRNTPAGSKLLVGKTHPNNTSYQKPLPENLSPESHSYPLKMHPTSHGIYSGHPSNPSPLFYILF